MARIAETDTCVGALLRPGDRGFGNADAPQVQMLIDRVRDAIGPDCLMRVRIDAAGDCGEIMRAIHHRGALFLTKAKMSRDLSGKVAVHRRWRTVDWDANGHPTRQIAEIDFRRCEWGEVGDLPVRVIAVRSRERDGGKQMYLWNDLDFTVQVYLTNDLYSDADELAWGYDGRAGIEPLIADWKNGWGLGKMSTEGFIANAATFLLKLLAHNLLRRFVFERVPSLRRWRTAWLRRALILVPGHITRSGHRRTLRIPVRPVLRALLN